MDKSKNYQKMINSEVDGFKDRENVHDLPPSHEYIANNYLARLLKEKIGVRTFSEMVVKYIRESRKPEADISILSLGSGNCDFEIDLVKNNRLKCKIVCYEINKFMLEKAAKKAKGNNLTQKFVFVESDANNIQLDSKYDIIIANHSLHHFVELEHIFSEVEKSMSDESVFLINDMIGKNGHEMWDATFDVVNRIWNILPKELKYNHLSKASFSKRVRFERMNFEAEGFEGIRAQDILPLLDKQFKFKDFAAFYAFVNKFVDRDFGPNYKLDNMAHKSLLDLIWAYDNYCLENKLLKPTQIIAALVKKDNEIDEYKYTYFEKPSEAYMIEDKAYLKYFDKDVFTLFQPGKKNVVQNLIWKTMIYAVIILKMFLRLPHYVLKKMVK